MDVLVTTDNHIEGNDDLNRRIEETVEQSLKRFSGQLTRVEVHVNDENSHKGGENDKRCMMEARVSGHQPVAVTHFAATIDQAVDGAVTRLRNALDRMLGRLSDRKGRTSFSGE